MSQILPVNNFKWVKSVFKLDEHFIKDFDQNISKNLFNLPSDLQFLRERNKTEKCNKLVSNIPDKEKLCCSHESFKAGIKSWADNKKST